MCLAHWAGLLGGILGLKGQLTPLYSGHLAPSRGSLLAPAVSLTLGAPGITSVHADRLATEELRGRAVSKPDNNKDARPLLCPPRVQTHPQLAPNSAAKPLLGWAAARPNPDSPAACFIHSLTDRELPLLACVDTLVLTRRSRVPIRFWGESPSTFTYGSGWGRACEPLRMVLGGGAPAPEGRERGPRS